MTLDRFIEICDKDPKAFIEYRKDRSNDVEYKEWLQIWDKEEEHWEKHISIYLEEFMELTSEQINKAISNNIENDKSWTLKNSQMSPFGSAMCTALFEIAQEKTKYESICASIDATENYKNRRDIVEIDEIPIEYGDCGCCVESGGVRTVFLSDKTKLKFDRHGYLIDTETNKNFFKWLKVLK